MYPRLIRMIQRVITFYRSIKNDYYNKSYTYINYNLNVFHLSLDLP